MSAPTSITLTLPMIEHVTATPIATIPIGKLFVEAPALGDVPIPLEIKALLIQNPKRRALSIVITVGFQTKVGLISAGYEMDLGDAGVAVTNAIFPNGQLDVAYCTVDADEPAITTRGPVTTGPGSSN